VSRRLASHSQKLFDCTEFRFTSVQIPTNAHHQHEHWLAGSFLVEDVEAPSL
jgi:hypothetical protein